MDEIALLKSKLVTAIKLGVLFAGPEFKQGFWRQGKYSNAGDISTGNIGDHDSIGQISKMGNEMDVVTIVDKHIEDLLIDEFSKRYQDDRFIGEESYSGNEGTGSPKEKIQAQEHVWFIDPIDGTNNFVHGFPLTAISIGMGIGKNDLRIGVVYLPITEDLYFGLKGQGSYLIKNGYDVISQMFINQKEEEVKENGVELFKLLTEKAQMLPLFRNNPLLTLSKASVITEHGSDRTDAVIEKRTNTMRRLLSGSSEYRVQNLRIIGAASVDMCQLSAGHADMYFENGPHIWDFAAASVILRESGGECYGTDVNPDSETGSVITEFDPWKRTIVAIRRIPDHVEIQGEKKVKISGKEMQATLVKQILKGIDFLKFESD